MSTDLAGSALATMRQLSVVPIPRNYEIFYEALSGTNHALSLEVVSLGNHPNQDTLDAIGRKFFSQHHERSIVETARETIAKELEDVAKLLRHNHSHMEKYGEVLHQTSGGLSERSTISRELLNKIVSVMSSATTSTLEHGRQIASSLKEKSAELETVKSALEEYKKLADTDPLTKIHNRRAFDSELAAIYADARSVMYTALILADIDRFKDINDRLGHPVGDRIIQSVADILRNSISSEMVAARTGGEEFALIVSGYTEQSVFGLADHIRQTIERTPVQFGNGNSQTAVTVSFGVCMASEGSGPEDLYAKADRALYRSKVEGRNRVTLFSAIQDKPVKKWQMYKTN